MFVRNVTSCLAMTGLLLGGYRGRVVVGEPSGLPGVKCSLGCRVMFERPVIGVVLVALSKQPMLMMDPRAFAPCITSCMASAFVDLAVIEAVPVGLPGNHSTQDFEHE